ncbi:MAG TPA: hypothetical protein V6D11_27110 [Waterburya sp.]
MFNQECPTGMETVLECPHSGFGGQLFSLSLLPNNDQQATRDRKRF